MAQTTSRNKLKARQNVTGEGFLGTIIGGLRFNSTSVPPYIRAGSYDIGGTIVNLTADKALATTDLLGDKSLRANLWYYVMMNNAGAVAIQLAQGGMAYVKTYSITSISGGNTINFTGSAGGTQPVAAMIAVIESATTGTNNGFWNIASVHGATVDYVVVDGTLTNQAGAGGTVKVYYRMSTFHASTTPAGAESGITTAASAMLYTPSPADAEYSYTNDWAGFDLVKNGYYSKWTGYTGYRILGVFSFGASTITNVISYRSGRNKNDNFFHFTGWNTLLTNTQVPKTMLRCWGNDYVYANDGSGGTVGTLFTTKRSLAASMSTNLQYATAMQGTIEVNGSNTMFGGICLTTAYTSAPANITPLDHF